MQRKRAHTHLNVTCVCAVWPEVKSKGLGNVLRPCQHDIRKRLSQTFCYVYRSPEEEEEEEGYCVSGEVGVSLVEGGGGRAELS